MLPEILMTFLGMEGKKAMGAHDLLIDPGYDDMKMFHRATTAMKVMRVYHRHAVNGLENVPLNGRAMFVINHAMVLYDIIMLWEAVYGESGRYIRTLVDRFFFKIPFLDQTTLRPMGISVANWDNARKLLAKDEMILLSPGGMREWGKPSSRRYTINWKGRMGYARLAIETQTPIILAACPKADDLYDIYDNPVSRFVYKKFRAPLVVTRGYGLTQIPRPIKLTHYLSEPLVPPKADGDEPSEAQVREFHAQVEARMKELLMEGIIAS